VNLPADAKLIVDDVVTKSTSATRLFTSPTLQPGMEYTYTLKAEVVRNGKTFTVSKRVPVHAGEETNVSLEIPADALAQR